MQATTARTLLDRLSPGAAHRVTGETPLDANARALLGAEAREGADDAPLQALMEQDRVAWDPKTRRLVGTETKIAIDEEVRPADKSATFATGIEQCMEFAMRYFRTEMARAGRAHGSFGEDWTKQHNIADEVRRMADGLEPRAGYTAYLNGGTVPPRAGDVMSFESVDEQKRADGSAPNFHVAIVSEVVRRDGNWFVRVYEANVPLQVNDPDIAKHYTEIPMVVRNGIFRLKSVKTRDKKYATDMQAVGWIHPRGQKALPGAVAAVRPGALGRDSFTRTA